MYLDANNLYGWAMSRNLPTGKFKRFFEKEINELDLSKYTNESRKRLILEVDLKIPKRLHDSHHCFPLVPEQINVNNNMLSNCSRLPVR